MDSRVSNESIDSNAVGARCEGGALRCAKDFVDPEEAQRALTRRKLRTVIGSLVGLFAIMAVLLALSHYSVRHGSGPRKHRDAVPVAPSSGSDPTNCVTPFGTFLGAAFHVPAYSNCNGDYTSNENDFVTVKLDPLRPDSPTVRIFAGMMHQCVAYARKALIMTRRLTFESVVGANDIFALSTVQDAVNNSIKYGFSTFRNGQTTTPPRTGDLLIYPIQPGGFPFGHVVYVAEVTATEVRIGEQNWDQKVWVHHNYSRALKLVVDEQTRLVTVRDQDYRIDGWKRPEVTAN